MLFQLAILLVNALAIHASVLSHTYPGDDIEALCAGKSVNLTTFSQLETLGQTVNAHASCSSNLKRAIPELALLIRGAKDDLCSASSIDQLREYYIKYLDTSNPANVHEELLPSSLRKFVIAYGMQTSNLCKKNMVSVLSDESKHLVEPSDYEQLEKLIKDNGPVARVLDGSGAPGEVFLPSDLLPFFKKKGIESHDDLDHDKLILQAATAESIKTFQSVCQHRFKPVYEPLMMPLVRLNNMGFNYRDEPPKCGLDECSKAILDVSRWSRIVFLCEALANIRVVNEGGENESNPKEQIRILTKEEADAIDNASRESSQADIIEDVVYTAHNNIMLADEIYDKSDKKLVKSIKSFDTNHGEDYILRKRVTKLCLAELKKQLKRGNFAYIISSAWKSRSLKRHGAKSPTKQLIEALDKIVAKENGLLPKGEDDDINTVSLAILFGVLLLVPVGIVLFCLGIAGVLG